MIFKKTKYPKKYRLVTTNGEVLLTTHHFHTALRMRERFKLHKNDKSIKIEQIEDDEPMSRKQLKKVLKDEWSGE